MDPPQLHPCCKKAKGWNFRKGLRKGSGLLGRQSSWRDSEGVWELHRGGDRQASSLLVLVTGNTWLELDMSSPRALNVTCGGSDGQDGRACPSSYSSSSPDRRDPPWKFPSNDWLQRLFFSH